MRVFAFLVATLIFASLSFGNPELLKAARAEDWEEVIRLLDEDSTVDINFVETEGPWRGVTALYLAAAGIRFDIVYRMLEKFPHANLDNPPRTVPAIQWPSVIWYAGFYNRWDLVTHMLDAFPQVDVSFAHTHGPYENSCLLRVAARANRWDIMERLILRYPLIAFEATLANELVPGSIVKLMLLQRLLNPSTEDIESIIDRKYDNRANALWELFEQVTWALPSECEAVDPAQVGWANLPRECQEIIAIHTLRAKDPDLAQIPTQVLRRALQHFRNHPILPGETVPRATHRKRERDETTAAEEGGLNEGELKRQVVADFPYIEDENIAPVAEALAENYLGIHQMSPGL